MERSDVVDRDPGNARATVIADLRDAPGIAASTYDCIILTQTLHVIDDMVAVLRECARILKPGGVLLATLPCLRIRPPNTPSRGRGPAPG
ncbi:MAG: methyltransferase domain-containing protein, partial [Candidatus Rokuibacteriota bacterium]